MRLSEETKKQIAIEVLSKSKMVRKWAKGELKAYDVDEDSPEGRKFISEKCKNIAEKILSGTIS